MWLVWLISFSFRCSSKSCRSGLILVRVTCCWKICIHFFCVFLSVLWLHLFLGKWMYIWYICMFHHGLLNVFIAYLCEKRSSCIYGIVVLYLPSVLLIVSSFCVINIFCINFQLFLLFNPPFICLLPFIYIGNCNQSFVVLSGIILVVRLLLSCSCIEKVSFQFRIVLFLFRLLWCTPFVGFTVGITICHWVLWELVCLVRSSIILLILIFHFVSFIIHNCNRIVIYNMVTGSVVYDNWMILFCSDGTFMSSAFTVHSVSCLPNILDITNIACHYIYYITGFVVEISSYGICVVVFVGNNLRGIHVVASQTSWLPTWLRKFGLWLEVYLWFYKHIFHIWASAICYFYVVWFDGWFSSH